ncbi:hypothetical protein BDF22DRAFT_492081 [Syncephalis plumigaleata]|nr:hypothetical protein BDF22DRAFT_492081 [Syncephalis plumigaleata]
MPDSLAPIASKPEESMASVAKERPAEQDSTHDESMQEAVEESTNAMNVDSPSKTDPQVNATIEKESKQQEEKQVENKAQEEEEESETSREVGQQDYTPIVESSAERVARQQSLHDILDILIIRSKPLLNKQQQQQQQQSDDNNIPVTLEEIKDRLSKGEYDTEKKITTQLILNDVCQYYNHQSTLSHWSAKDRTAIEELRDLGRALLQRIGADHPSWRKRSLNENDDNSNDHMQVENETENNNDNTEDVNSVDESAQRPTKVALYQRGTDAYLFSGTSTLNAFKMTKMICQSM